MRVLLKAVALWMAAAALAGAIASPARAQEAEAAQTPFEYGRGRNIGVSERPRPEFDPKGLDLGGVRLFPRVTVEAGPDSNIFYTPAPEQDDVALVVTPQIDFQTEWSNHRISGAVGLADWRYQDSSSENRTDLFARGEGRFDLARDTFILIGGSQERLTERRGAPDSPLSAAKPLRYEARAAYLQGVHVFNRARVSLRLDRENLNFKDAPLVGGGVADQDERDRTTTTATARLEYALSPDAAFVAQVAGNTRDYVLHPPRTQFDRDSTGTTYLAGFNADLTNLVRAELIAGYLQQDYDDPALRSANGLAVEGRLEYFPTSLTTIKVFARRRVEETLTGTASSYLATYLEAQVDHELRRNIILSAAVGGTNRDFRGQDRSDEILTAEAKARFLLNRRLEVGARWQYETQDSSGPVADPDYSVNRLLVSATARF